MNSSVVDENCFRTLRQGRRRMISQPVWPCREDGKARFWNRFQFLGKHHQPGSARLWWPRRGWG